MFSKPFQRYLHLKYLTLQNSVKTTEYHIRNGPNRWQISTCIQVIPEHVLLALLLAFIVFEILTFEIFDLEKVGEGHGVQHSQCRSQIVNVKIYKCQFLHF